HRATRLRRISHGCPRLRALDAPAGDGAGGPGEPADRSHGRRREGLRDGGGSHSCPPRGRENHPDGLVVGDGDRRSIYGREQRYGGAASAVCTGVATPDSVAGPRRGPAWSLPDGHDGDGAAAVVDGRGRRQAEGPNSERLVRGVVEG